MVEGIVLGVLGTAGVMVAVLLSAWATESLTNDYLRNWRRGRGR